MNKRYASDLTDNQWQKVKPFVEKSFGRPAQVSRRAVVNAILYVLRTGCQWRYLPLALPAAGVTCRWRYLPLALPAAGVTCRASFQHGVQFMRVFDAGSWMAPGTSCTLRCMSRCVSKQVGRLIPAL